MLPIQHKSRSRSYYGTWFTFRTQFIPIYNITDPYKCFYAKKLYGESVIFLLSMSNCTLNKMWILSYMDYENDILWIAAEGMFCSNEITETLTQAYERSNTVSPIWSLDNTIFPDYQDSKLVNRKAIKSH